ncbi:hypothetical protein KC322_g117 [Hortaea werneckii]|nr:hypothetical protein KC322_g117 [Hortaea werneckii]
MNNIRRLADTATLLSAIFMKRQHRSIGQEDLERYTRHVHTSTNCDHPTPNGVFMGARFLPFLLTATSLALVLPSRLVQPPDDRFEAVREARRLD